MEIKVLTKENFMLYAMGNYTNPDCIGVNEFMEDISKIKYVKRLLKKYARSRKIRPILLLNHLVVLGNVFGRTPTARMLFFKLEEDVYPSLKTVLLYLDYIDENCIFDGLVVSDIALDQQLADTLKRL
jgi:hypothetical protein